MPGPATQSDNSRVVELTTHKSRDLDATRGNALEGAPHQGTVKPAKAEDPLAGLKNSMAWQFAWQTAIALAWSSKKDRDLLFSDPRTFFKVHARYDLPEGLDLAVEEMSVDAQGREPGWDPQTSTWYLQNTKLTMYLPPAPPVEQRAVALAAYNATARTYPFTIC